MISVEPRIISQPSIFMRMGKVLVPLVALGLVFVGAVIGQYFTDQAGRDAIDERKVLLAKIEGFEKENKQLKRAAAVLQTSSEVDRLAVQHAQKSLAELQNELSETGQELAFYRRVISPEKKSNKLFVQDFRVLDDSGFQYWLALSRGMGKGGLVKGGVAIIFTGRSGNKKQKINLHDIDSQKGRKLSFQFRNFQLLKGAFSLPKGFIPDTVEVQITPRTRGVKNISRNWTWAEIVKKVL